MRSRRSRSGPESRLRYRWTCSGVQRHSQRRLDLGVLQREAAERIGVTEGTLWNWENGKAEPALPWVPSILRFIGYNPWPEPTTSGQALKRYRHRQGITQEELAVRLTVDPSTLAR